jgi:hypothetical protein
MNEQAARQITLVRAVEEADAERQVLSDDDRLYATRSAMELARWEVTDKKSVFTAALFLQKRAEQIVLKLVERHPSLARLAAPRTWPRLLAAVLPILALLTGVLVDRVTNPHRVDLLSAPLILILLWNLVVYLWLLGWWLAGLVRKSPHSPWRWTRAWRPKATGLSKLPPPLAKAVSQFAAEWLRLSAPLMQARLSRAIHLSAALFALGAIGSLALRGLFTQYRAGWESTFLSAEQVHTLLHALFTPAMTLFSLPGFSLAEVQALRNTASASPDTGAQWVVLYAATLFLMVVLPRLALAAMSWISERRLRHNLPVDLTQPYFRKLTAGLDGAATAWVQVFPYSFAVDAAHQQGLSQLAKVHWGDNAQVQCQASTAYGDDVALPSSDAAAAPALTVALFNLSATPERENHGEFLDQLALAHERKMALWVDESAYRERVGRQAGGAARVSERVALWRQFGELHQLPVTIVNLLHPTHHPIEPGAVSRVSP